jgi:hypothetical protein
VFVLVGPEIFNKEGRTFIVPCTVSEVGAGGAYSYSIILERRIPYFHDIRFLFFLKSSS